MLGFFLLCKKTHQKKASPWPTAQVASSAFAASSAFSGSGDAGACNMAKAPSTHAQRFFSGDQEEPTNFQGSQNSENPTDANPRSCANPPCLSNLHRDTLSRYLWRRLRLWRLLPDTRNTKGRPDPRALPTQNVFPSTKWQPQEPAAPYIDSLVPTNRQFLEAFRPLPPHLTPLCSKWVPESESASCSTTIWHKEGRILRNPEARPPQAPARSAPPACP